MSGHVSWSYICHYIKIFLLYNTKQVKKCRLQMTSSMNTSVLVIVYTADKMMVKFNR